MSASDTNNLLSAGVLLSGQYKVVSKKKNEKLIEFKGDEAVGVFVSSCSVQFGIQSNRIRLTYEKPDKSIVVLDSRKDIGSYNIPNGSTLVLKDLGIQIGYRTVFVLEYLGPFLIFPLVFLFQKLIHSYYNPETEITYGPFQYAQILGLILWTLHYAKRIYETIFVHSFSHATMPIGNLAKNCTYYWGFAFLIAYVVSHPLYTSPHIILVVIGTIIFCVSEYFNFSTHYYLSTLRDPASKAAGIDHPIPTKWMFHYAICPNYSFEILSWVGFNLATSTAIGILFNLAGAAQMLSWAKGKKKRYQKELGETTNPKNPDFPKKVKLLFPYLI